MSARRRVMKVDIVSLKEAARSSEQSIEYSGDARRNSCAISSSSSSSFW